MRKTSNRGGISTRAPKNGRYQKPGNTQEPVKTKTGNPKSDNYDVKIQRETNKATINYKVDKAQKSSLRRDIKKLLED